MELVYWKEGSFNLELPNHTYYAHQFVDHLCT